MNKITIVSDILKTCSDLAKDDYWKLLFLSLSEGKYTKYVFITDNIVYSYNKKKKISYMIQSDKDIHLTLNELYTFLSYNENIYSSYENEKKKKLIEEEKKNKKEKEKHIMKWSSVKKKSEKEMLIISYVLDQKTQYDLNWNDTRDLLNLISTGFLYKTQVSNDVVMKDGKIKYISGIEYNQDLKKFENLYIDQRIKNTTKEKHQLFSNGWKRYYDMILKNILQK